MSKKRKQRTKGNKATTAPTRRSVLKGAALWAADKAAGGVVGAATFGTIQKLVTSTATPRQYAYEGHGGATAGGSAAVAVEWVWEVPPAQPIRLLRV